MGKFKDQYLLEDASAPVATPSVSVDSDWEAVLLPEIDFLPGPMLEASPAALAAVQRSVDDRVRRIRPGIMTKWTGTHVGFFEHGSLLGNSEVHGATWKRGTNEVAGIRIDMSVLAKR